MGLGVEQPPSKCNALQNGTYSLEVKSRRIRCAEHVARMEQRRPTYMVSVERPEGKNT